MAQATIGSLNVVLGMDAADFDRGVKKIEDGIGKLATKFGFIAGVAAEVGRQLIQGLGNALVGLVGMFRSAIDSADALDELAQKLGFSAKALSEIKYAAEISGVPVETFTQGITKLSDALAGIAGGDTKSDPARTLQALGISAVDAGGQLRSMEDVIVDIADKFAGFEDSTAKTGLAINLFGQRAGAQLIPFLNQGRAGISELREEAERLGISLTNKAAKSAGDFNESLDKLTMIINAGFKQAMERMLPYLQQAVTWLLENDRAFKVVNVTVDVLAFALKSIASVWIALAANIENATTRLLGFNAAAAAAMTFNFTEAGAQWSAMTEQVRKNTQEATDSINRLWGSMQGQSGGNELDTSGMMKGIDDLSGGQKGQAPIVTSTQALAEAAKAATDAQALHNKELARFNQLRAEGKRLYEETLDPIAKLEVELERVNELHRKGALLASEHAAVQQKLATQTINAYAGIASGIAGNLSKVFGESKAFAIAQAIINTAESVTKTLATYGYTPWGIAAAAAAAAAGLAEVATIRNAGKGSGGGSSSGSYSSSSVNSTSGGGNVQNVQVETVGDGAFIERASMRRLFERMAEYQQDGGSIRVNMA